MGPMNSRFCINNLLKFNFDFDFECDLLAYCPKAQVTLDESTCASMSEKSLHVLHIYTCSALFFSRCPHRISHSLRRQILSRTAFAKSSLSCWHPPLDSLRMWLTFWIANIQFQTPTLQLLLPYSVPSTLLAGAVRLFSSYRVAGRFLSAQLHVLFSRRILLPLLTFWIKELTHGKVRFYRP